ncbi:hypothetical protein A2U01_0075021, partial [Trifolium medium]|nr:hypothetical protein [Trifolium medium]
IWLNRHHLHHNGGCRFVMITLSSYCSSLHALSQPPSMLSLCPSSFLRS